MDGATFGNEVLCASATVEDILAGRGGRLGGGGGHVFRIIHVAGIQYDRGCTYGMVAAK